MKYSVILPCFNSEKTIYASVASVVSQVSEYYAIQLIIIDDKSSDSSLKVINDIVSRVEGTKNLEVLVVRNPINIGVSRARNIGIEKASGQYVLFLDSDDCFSDDKIVTIDKLVSESKVDFLFHAWSVEGSGCSNVGYSKLAKVNRRFIYWNLIKNHICTPCTVISRDKVQLFDESLRRMEDLENWTRIMLRCENIYWLDEPLTSLGHELNGGSGLSSNNVAMRQAEYDMYRILARKNKWLALLLPVYLSVHFLKRLRDAFRK